MTKRIFIILFLLFILGGCDPRNEIIGSKDVYVNESITLSIEGYDEDITWESSDEAVATVEEGIVNGISVGEVRIFVYYKHKYLNHIEINVLAGAIIEVDGDSVIARNDSKPLFVESEIFSDEFYFKSLDKNIATVDYLGNVKGVNNGETSIVVTSKYHGYYVFPVTVIEFYNPESIEITNTLNEYIIGEPYTLIANVLPLYSIQEVTWEVLGNKATLNSETNEIVFNDIGDVYVICRSAYDQTILKSTKLTARYGDDVDVTNILFIGNSHTYFNDVPGLVEGIGKANGMAINCESITEGGATIARLLDLYHTNLINYLESDDYDYIIVQEQSTLNFLNRNQFLTAVQQLQEIVFGYDIEIYLYQTWAYREGSDLLKSLNLTRPEMHQEVYNSYHYVARETGLSINPVGDVFNDFLIDHPDVNIYNDDNHANLAGSYLSACVHFVNIFQENIIGNKFTLSISEGVKLKIQIYVSNYILNK